MLTSNIIIIYNQNVVYMVVNVFRIKFKKNVFFQICDDASEKTIFRYFVKKFILSTKKSYIVFFYLYLKMFKYSRYYFILTVHT
jgi:hypothetical protein